MLWLKSRRLHFLLGGVALLFTLFAALRLLFVAGFSGIDAMAYEPRADFWQTLGIGLRFDLRLAIIGMLPLALLAYLPRFNLATSRLMRLLGRGYVAAGLLFVLLLYIIDMGHYSYLKVRLNSTAWRFVEDTSISATMVWQSYPVVWITLGWLAAALALFAAFVALERRTLQRQAVVVITKKSATLGSVIMVVLTLLGLLGRVTDINPENPVPLRWSDAFSSGDIKLAAVGLNPVIFFLYDTAWMKDEPFDRELVAHYYPLMAEYLGIEQPNAEALDYRRQVGVQPHSVAGDRPPNVVFIMLESLNASRLGIHGNPLQPTPNMDRLAREGWFFKRFFVPVTGTAKTVWASITGTPDVTQGETATRNPLITKQNTLINAFTGYDKLYMIGGAAGWANMSALVRQSIDGVELYEEGYWQAPNVDVWGISDLDLFREADQILRQRKDKPFFAYIQTAGNHRPYTIPADHENFEVLEPADGEVQKWSFTDNDQYNATRFLDYSIGRFMEMAKAGGYLDNTIFVMFGDHGTTITTQPHMPPLYEQLWLESNHTPLIIYAPGLLQPRLVEDAMSLVDMLPTVAGMAGVPYANQTQGRDYQLSAGRERAVPVVLVEGAFPIIGMVTQDFMVKMNYDGTDVSMHAMDSATPKEDVSGQHPEEFARLRELTRGAYETGRYMLYDNVRK